MRGLDSAVVLWRAAWWAAIGLALSAWIALSVGLAITHWCLP